MERNVNTTAPMLTLTHLYEITGKETYRWFMEEWVQWMMDETGLLRAGEGCFQHMITGDPNDGEILIDTLFMAVFFLAPGRENPGAGGSSSGRRIIRF